MLRRQPTKITLLQDDIIAYDARNSAKNKRVHRDDLFAASAKTKSSTDIYDTNPILARNDLRSRDQRLGLAPSST